MSPGTADVQSDRPDHLRIDTSSEGEGFMVMAITKSIGWSATIDGRSVPIHAVDGPFMGILVPPGHHVVRLTFRPVLMWAGTLAAGLTFGGAWIGGIFGTALRRRKARPSVASAEARPSKASLINVSQSA
jgi:hypothetical protein